MVETIAPVVYGGRGRWAGALILHVAGATLAAGAFGAALGGLGAMLGAPWGRAGLMAVAVAATVYAIGELPRAPVPVPALRRQVPDWWRTYFGPSMTALLYGAGLGIGFFTFLAHGTLLVVSVAALASGRPLVGALVVGAFGLVRGLSAVVASGVDTTERGRTLVDRLVARSDGARRVANVAALLAIAGLAAGLAMQRAGGWGTLASAATALVFGWSAASKVLAPRRWRRGLSGHRLGLGLERVARWAVPAAESAVPALALLGYRSASAIWALALLVGFSIQLVRVGRLVGSRVPCGCFGGRGSIEIGRALLRNVALALMTGVALVGSPDAPRVRPAMPTGSDVLPAALVVAGLVVAALAAWRSTVWLGRARNA